MSGGVTHLRLDAIEALRPAGDGVPPRWLPLRHLLDATCFGLNVWEAEAAGDWVVEPHDEDGDPGHEELYVVLRGAADFDIGDESFTAEAGDLVFVADPTLHRQARAAAPATRVMALGAPKGSFGPSEWETRWLREAQPADL